jgi:hypothetical protein
MHAMTWQLAYLLCILFLISNTYESPDLGDLAKGETQTFPEWSSPLVVFGGQALQQAQAAVLVRYKKGDMNMVQKMCTHVCK